MSKTVCPTSVFGAQSFCLPVSPIARSTGQTRKQNLLAKEQKYLLLQLKTFFLVVRQNVLAEHEMFKKFGGSEKTCKDTWLKQCYVGQTMLVSITGPLIISSY